MHYALYVFFITFPFGQLLRIDLVPGIVLHPIDFFAATATLTWIASGKAKKLLTTPLSPQFIAFLLVATYSLMFNANTVLPNQLLQGIAYLARLGIYIFFHFALYDFAKSKQQKNTLQNSLVILGTFIAVFGLIQYLFFPDTRLLANAGWDSHYARLVGTFLDPGFTGIILVLFTIFTISFTNKRAEWGKAILPVVLGTIATALTFSRASYLAFLAGVSIVYIVRRNLFPLVAILALFFITIWIAPKPGGEGVNLTRTSTINKRLVNYKEAIETFKKYPLFGTGFNLYQYKRTDLASKGQTFQGFQGRSHSASGADSSLLFVLATTGVIGLIAYLTLLWAMVKSAKLPLLATTIALLIHSNFDNSLFYPWVLAWFAILLALNQATSRASTKSSRSSQSYSRTDLQPRRSTRSHPPKENI